MQPEQIPQPTPQEQPPQQQIAEAQVINQQVQVTEFTAAPSQAPAKSQKLLEYIALALVAILLLSFLFDFTGVAKILLAVSAISAAIVIFLDMRKATDNFRSEVTLPVVSTVQNTSDKPKKTTTRKVVEGTAIVVGVSILLVVSVPIMGIMLIIFLVAINGGQSA